MVQLDSGWTVSHENNTFIVDSLNNAHLGTVNYKERVILENTLPDSDL